MLKCELVVCYGCSYAVGHGHPSTGHVGRADAASTAVQDQPGDAQPAAAGCRATNACAGENFVFVVLVNVRCSDMKLELPWLSSGGAGVPDIAGVV